MRCEWPDFEGANFRSRTVRLGLFRSPYTTASATSDCRQFLLVRLGATMAGPDSQPDPWYLHQSAKAAAPIGPP